jgi:hypothetical protein
MTNSMFLALNGSAAAKVDTVLGDASLYNPTARLAVAAGEDRLGNSRIAKLVHRLFLKNRGCASDAFRSKGRLIAENISAPYQ